MNVLTVIMLVFAILAALDRVFGNRLGLGKEFEKGFMLLGPMSLSMIGMIVIAPVLAQWLSPVFSFVNDTFGLDPSVIPAAIFANDMGGAPLAKEVACDMDIGMWNALVVSSMMGCTVSYTVPFALNLIPHERHDDFLLGILCGIVTIPVGCFVGGVISGIPVMKLLFNLVPLCVTAIVIIIALKFCPKIAIRVFTVISFLITLLIMFGLVVGMLHALTGKELLKGASTVYDGAEVCINGAIILSGAFPLMFTVSRLIKRPLSRVSRRVGINDTSTFGLVSMLVSSTPVFDTMRDMDKKGLVINAAFSVSGAFLIGGHLAFTMAFDKNYVLPVLVGKLTAGILAVLFAYIIVKSKKDE